MPRRLILAAALASIAVLSIAGTTVLAQPDPIKERQALLKEFGRVSRPLGGMLKGEAPFDLATVQAALDTYAKNAQLLPALFPAGSGTGDTEALPAVWERNDDFKARFAKFGADAASARVAITDEASFKATFPTLIRQCGGCHETYRQKK